MTLPTEIWRKIFDHLPSATRIRCIGIDRVCLDLALQEIYQELNVERSDEASLQRLELLQYDNLDKLRCPILTLV